MNKVSDIPYKELTGKWALYILYSQRIMGLTQPKNSVQGGISFHRSIRKIKSADKKTFQLEGSFSKFDMDGHELPTVQATQQSTYGYVVILSDKEVKEFKRYSEYRKKVSDAKAVLSDVSKRLKGKPLEEVGKAFHEQYINPKPFKSKIDMNLIEAKVEAAAASRMWGRDVYIVKKKEHPDSPMGVSYEGEGDYAHVLDTAPPKYVTWYRGGAERGEGVNVGATKMTTKQPKIANVAFVTEEDGSMKKVPLKSKYNHEDNGATAAGDNKLPRQPKAPRTKTPTVLEKRAYKSIVEAAGAESTCLATIGKGVWVVAVQTGWGLKKSLMEQCVTGLILVIKGQGYYTYDKKMWKEFEGIFASKSYSEGGSYVQSKLPAKFDKYFTKSK